MLGKTLLVHVIVATTPKQINRSKNWVGAYDNYLANRLVRHGECQAPHEQRLHGFHIWNHLELQALLPKLRFMNLLLTTLEPGMVPGPALSAIETTLWFVVAPIALFIAISALSFAGSAKRDKKKSVIDQIDY